MKLLGSRTLLIITIIWLGTMIGILAYLQIWKSPTVETKEKEGTLSIFNDKKEKVATMDKDGKELLLQKGFQCEDVSKAFVQHIKGLAAQHEMIVKDLASICPRKEEKKTKPKF